VSRNRLLLFSMIRCSIVGWSVIRIGLSLSLSPSPSIQSTAPLLVCSIARWRCLAASRCISSRRRRFACFLESLVALSDLSFARFHKWSFHSRSAIGFSFSYSSIAVFLYRSACSSVQLSGHWMPHCRALCLMYEELTLLPLLCQTIFFHRSFHCRALFNSGEKSTSPIASFRHFFSAYNIPSFRIRSIRSISCSWSVERDVVEVA